MNTSVDVCDDFFEFACGGFKPEIPNDKSKVDVMGMLLDSLQERLNHILSAASEANEIEPIKKVKAFYKNCMETGLKEERKQIELIKNFVHRHTRKACAQAD